MMRKGKEIGGGRQEAGPGRRGIKKGRRGWRAVRFYKGFTSNEVMRTRDETRRTTRTKRSADRLDVTGYFALSGLVLFSNVIPRPLAWAGLFHPFGVRPFYGRISSSMRKCS